ncbi:hypothetical protein GCM10010495_44170 [Kitasatospora herbaricolor]|nr:hypothetical protein GCM10010495_44170 [Kitasatospora herbaricolor]
MRMRGRPGRAAPPRHGRTGRAIADRQRPRRPGLRRSGANGFPVARPHGEPPRFPPATALVPPVPRELPVADRPAHAAAPGTASAAGPSGGVAGAPQGVDR